MVAQGRATLTDILLLFIYLEIGAMVGISFKTTRLPVRYLIYIAITALGRILIEIVGAEQRTGIDILVITGGDSPSVIRRPGPKVRVIQISIRQAGGRLGWIKSYAAPKRRLVVPTQADGTARSMSRRASSGARRLVPYVAP